LSHFVTLAPPNATVRDDLVAIHGLLASLSPLDSHANSATLADPASRRIGASLNGAVAAMTDIGDQSAAAFGDLARAGALRLNARDLPRDLVTADPDLAQAKLRSALVAPPTALTGRVIGAFDAVRGHPLSAFASTAITGRGPSYLEREMKAMTLARTDSPR
ncbi:MAG TPA: hypothetical protein VFE45_11500, partial [Coriobacteriia bacterium]|nr:hypothetical protein [Coriobacteriia bacterium]